MREREMLVIRYSGGLDAGPLKSGGDKHRNEKTEGGEINWSLECVGFEVPIRFLCSKGKLTAGVPRRFNDGLQKYAYIYIGTDIEIGVINICKYDAYIDDRWRSSEHSRLENSNNSNIKGTPSAKCTERSKGHRHNRRQIMMRQHF